MLRSLFLLAAAFISSSNAEMLFPVEFSDLNSEFTKTDATGDTHYGDPTGGGCLADEKPFRIMGVPGSVCCPECTSSPCPTDVPDGVTATPTCVLQMPTTGAKFCALICSPSTEPKMLRAGDSMCGAGTCQPVKGTGICTYG